MSYRRALLGRWSRRDVLAVLVVAASVAFLTGAGLVGHAATTELAGVAEEFESPASASAFDEPAAAEAASGDGDVVLPLARAEHPSGREVTVVGVPTSAATFAEASGVPLPRQPPDGELRGPVAEPRTVGLQGDTGAVETRVAPRSTEDALPARWYVADPSTVEQLGPSGAVVLSPSDGPTPVVGVLSFFLVGSRQVVRSLGLATAAAGVLLAVTVFSATRMTVRDRMRTVRVARATGAPPRDLLALFAARAGLQTAVGVAGGYAVGVIAPNAAVNVAVFLGQSTSLSLQVSRHVAEVLVPSYAALVGVGALGGALAALPAVRRPPAHLATRAAPRDDASRLPSVLQPDLLDWRAVVPTGTTLGVFIVVAVVVASASGVVAPLAGGSGTTVTEPGAAHPFASTVPEAYAAELRAQGVTASPEILALGVTGGRPYVARGANFAAFANVTDASVASGRAPSDPGEAILGVDLARTLGVEVGEPLVVGGSTHPAVDRLRIVGTYRSPEPYDDQLVVTLATARALSGTGPGQVQFVRTDERPEPEAGEALRVVDVDVPATVTAGDSLAVTVTLLNTGADDQSRTVRASLDGHTEAVQVALAPEERRTVRLELPAGEPRDATLSVAGDEYAVRVVDPGAIRFVDLPERAPPDSEPRVRVATATGEPISEATVSVDGTTVTTDESGWTRVPLGEAGRHRVSASDGERTVNATVEIREDAVRQPEVTARVSPDRPTPATRPTVDVVLTNPWNRTLSVPLTVDGPTTESAHAVELAPGERTTVTEELDQQPPGTYEIAVRSEGTELAATSYDVAGDPRLAAALATSGRDRASTGIGRALSVVLGNIRLVVATMLGLAALMTVGGTTAAFASTVHARRRTLGIHRSTGATPRQVLGLVLRDAARVGTVATGLGLVLAGGALLALDATGMLTMYGVRVLSTVDPFVVATSAMAALGLALIGAGLATWGLLRQSPSSQLAGGSPGASQGGEPGD